MRTPLRNRRTGPLRWHEPATVERFLLLPLPDLRSTLRCERSIGNDASARVETYPPSDACRSLSSFDAHATSPASR